MYTKHIYLWRGYLKNIGIHALSEDMTDYGVRYLRRLVKKLNLLLLLIFLVVSVAVFFKIVGTVYPNFLKRLLLICFLYSPFLDSMILNLLVRNS